MPGNTLVSLLRSAGLRATRPRILVLELLRQRGHRTVDDLVKALRGRGTPLPRTSVYNVLRDLRRCGLVMETGTGEGRAVYDLAEQWHHHFICRVCGRTLDVDCPRGDRSCVEAHPVVGRVEEVQVVFRGVCHDCTRKGLI